jgi:AcrR family transcriptional regulator
MTPASIATLIPCSPATVRTWLRTGTVRPRWRLRVAEVVGSDPSPIAERLRRACSDPAPVTTREPRRVRAHDIAAACGVSPGTVTRWLDTRTIPPQHRRIARTFAESGRPMTRPVQELASILRAYEITDTITALRAYAERVPAAAGAIARAVEALERIQL